MYNKKIYWPKKNKQWNLKYKKWYPQKKKYFHKKHYQQTQYTEPFPKTHWFMRNYSNIFFKLWDKAVLEYILVKLGLKKKRKRISFYKIPKPKYHKKQYWNTPKATWHPTGTACWFQNYFGKHQKNIVNKAFERILPYPYSKRYILKKKSADPMLSVSFKKYYVSNPKFIVRLLSKKRFKVQYSRFYWNLNRRSQIHRNYQISRNINLKSWFMMAKVFKLFYSSLFNKSTQLSLTRKFIRLKKLSFKEWALIQQTLPIILWRANYTPSIAVSTWLVEQGIFTVDYSIRPVFNKFFVLKTNQVITLEPTLYSVFAWWFIKRHFSKMLFIKKTPSYIFTPNSYKKKKRYFVFVKLLKIPSPSNDRFYFNNDMPKKYLKWFVV